MTLKTFTPDVGIEALVRAVDASMGSPDARETLTKAEVLQRLCALATRVGAAGAHQKATDCFCEGNPHAGVYYRFDRFVMEFIEAAVAAALADK